MSIELKAALRSLDVFQALDDRVLDQILPFVSTRLVKAGETIFCQGEPSPCCYGIFSGKIVIQHVSKDGRFPPKVLSILGPGHLFGESSFFEDSPRAAMASAMEDGKLVMIRGTLLREWTRQHADLGHPLLMALLKTSLERLRRTSHELAIVNGVSRLLGSNKAFLDQWGAALEFLKGSLPEMDDLVFYQRNVYWDELNPAMSLPTLTDLPALPLKHALVQKVCESGGPVAFSPIDIRKVLADCKLPWQDRKGVTIMPLFDRDQPQDPLEGLLWLTSSQSSAALDREKQLLLSAVSHPLAEALSRYRRQEEARAQARLEQSKSFYRP